MRVLAIVAMQQELEALLREGCERRDAGNFEQHISPFAGGEIAIVASGVGPAAAATATASVLATDGPFDLALSVGIAGAFPEKGVEVGDLVVATEAIAADLGIKTDQEWWDPLMLEWLPGRLETTPWFNEAAVAAGAVAGPVLTVSTVAATAPDGDELAQRHPSALAVAMEGVGVATAARRWSTPFAELRTMSDRVGDLTGSLDFAGSLKKLRSYFWSVVEELPRHTPRPSGEPSRP